MLYPKEKFFFYPTLINFSIPDAPFSTFSLITPLTDPSQLEGPPLKTMPRRTEKENTQVHRLGETFSAVSPHDKVTMILTDDGPSTTSPSPPTDETPSEVPSLQTPTHKIAPQSPMLAENSSAASFQELGWMDDLTEEKTSNTTAEVGGIGEVIPSFENSSAASFQDLGWMDDLTEEKTSNTTAEVGGIGEVIPSFEKPTGTSPPNGLGDIDEGTRTYTSRHHELAKIVNR